MPKRTNILNASTLIAVFLLLFLFLFLFIYVMTYGGEMSYEILSAEIYPPPHIGNALTSNFYGVSYTALAVLFAVLFVAAGIVDHPCFRTFVFKDMYKQLVFPFFVVLYLAITFFQTFVHAQYFAREKADFQGKSLEQKQTLLFQFAYTFAKEVRRMLPGEHIAQIVSDLDLEQTMEMTLHRQFCYFLYPINARIYPQGQVPEVLILLGKKDAIHAIPPGYRLLLQYDDENLVAVKIRNEDP